MEDELEKLRKDNAVLTEQIKHLLKAKHDLSLIQSRVESQFGLYKDLYETGSAINAALELDEVFAAILDFVIYKLNIERCVIFLDREETFFLTPVAMEGYYDEDLVAAVNALVLDRRETGLAETLTMSSCVVAPGQEGPDGAKALAGDLHMDRLVAFPFLDEVKSPIGLLVAGNSEDNAEYYSLIERDSDVFVGLANISALANTAVNNILSYKALHQERALLETRVRERTQDLTREIEERSRIEDQLNFILETSPVGISTVDRKSLQRLYSNPTFRDLIGYGPDDDITMDHPVKTFADADVLADLQARYEKDGYVSGAVVERTRLDGSSWWALTDWRPIVYDGRDALIIWHYDITDRIQAEEALVKAKQEAEAATAAKSDFLARMSHEIRTPMNAVLGLTHLALRTELTPKQKDYLRKIRGSSQALLGIINDILDFSKIEAGKLTLESIVFDLHDVLDNLANVVTLKAEEKGLEVLLGLDARVPHTLKGDPLRLGQVLVNLATNAVKFTHKGEIVVTTDLVSKDDGVARIRFSVRDTGIGLTEEQMAGLFQSFHQADGSITRKYGGTGLGLAISKQLVEMMGGTLGVTSLPNSGSTFFFEVPLDCVADDARPKFLIPPEIEGQSVLVVDDNETARDILRAMLESFSFVVETADSGETALSLLERRSNLADDPFSIVFMDWKMPGMDGIEAAMRIKQDPKIGHTPAILMVTAYGREEIMRRAEEAGVDGFLAKPVGQSLLFNTVLETLGHDVDRHGVLDRYGRSGASRLEWIRGAKVLLVEDNPINQQVAIEFLEQAGLVVDLAENGVVAVKKAVSGNYELIFMDVQMPEMDGLEATRRIRSGGCTDLPIVAMTAHAMARDRELSLAAGMNDHLTKPIDPQELEDMLVRWIPAKERTVPENLPHRRRDSASTPLPMPEIDGLNADLGVRRVGGSPALFLDLLKEFAERNENAADRIRTEMAAKDVKVAERAAHSIKGSSASLGAERLAEAAEDVEKALRAGDRMKAEKALPAFARELGILCSGIQAFFSGIARETSEVSASEAAADPGEVLAELERLSAFLETGNSKAERIAAALRPAADSLDFGADLDAIEEAIEDVEFAEALDLVKGLVTRLEGEV